MFLICGGMFEKLISNALFSLFEDHKLLDPDQSGYEKKKTSD